jgi:hydroxyacylglutathione hydrolase
MWFEKIVAEGLSHTSYMIGSGGKAAVVDPRRDCDIYLDLADRNDALITHIFETHRNEDYVSGARELAHLSGAPIFHGPRMDFAYGNITHEGARFIIGTLEISVLETPGHTEESLTFVLADTEVSREPYMVFSGDTLFAGDIARTDLAGPDQKAAMAEKMYASITRKILSLGDGVILCPAHGAGSVCGEEIADHPFSTIGYEKHTNPVLALGHDTFITRRTAESPYLPPYFRQMEKVNREGPALLVEFTRPYPITVTEVTSRIASGCQIVDVRSPTAFAAGHIPGSLSIWGDGIPSFAGWFLDYNRPIVLIDDFSGNLAPLFRHFSRLGYDNTTGWIAGGFPAWYRAAQPVEMTGTCSVQELKDLMSREKPFLLDVRDKKNREQVGYIPDSVPVYIGELEQHIPEIPKYRPVFVYCDSGYKGSLGVSVLAMHGYTEVTNVLGGMQAWVRAGFAVEH